MPKRASAKTSKKGKKKQGRQPAAKLARDWSPLSRILKVPPCQKRFRQTRRSTSPITLPLLPAGDGDDERRKIQAPRGANYHIEICLTLHEDNVGHEVHARKHNDSQTRESGGPETPETPRTRNVVPNVRKEGENMCVGNDNNKKKPVQIVKNCHRQSYVILATGSECGMTVSASRFPEPGTDFPTLIREVS